MNSSRQNNSTEGYNIVYSVWSLLVGFAVSEYFLAFIGRIFCNRFNPGYT